MNKKIVIKDPKIIGSKTIRYRTVELPQEFKDRMLEIEKEEKREKEERKKNNVIRIRDTDFKIEEMDELDAVAEIIYSEEEQIIRIKKGLSKEERQLIIIRAIIHIIFYIAGVKEEITSAYWEIFIKWIAELIQQVIEDNYL